MQHLVLNINLILGTRKFNISSAKLSDSLIMGTKGMVSIVKFTSKL